MEPGEGGFIANWISLLDEAQEKVAQAHGTHGDAAERAMEMEAVKVSLANLRTFLHPPEGKIGRTDVARCSLRDFGRAVATAR